MESEVFDEFLNTCYLTFLLFWHPISNNEVDTFYRQSICMSFNFVIYLLYCFHCTFLCLLETDSSHSNPFSGSNKTSLMKNMFTTTPQEGKFPLTSRSLLRYRDEEDEANWEVDGRMTKVSSQLGTTSRIRGKRVNSGHPRKMKDKYWLYKVKNLHKRTFSLKGILLKYAVWNVFNIIKIF
jgi:hypothetical protein